MTKKPLSKEGWELLQLCKKFFVDDHYKRDGRITCRLCGKEIENKNQDHSSQRHRFVRNKILRMTMSSHLTGHINRKEVTWENLGRFVERVRDGEFNLLGVK